MSRVRINRAIIPNSAAAAQATPAADNAEAAQPLVRRAAPDGAGGLVDGLLDHPTRSCLTCGRTSTASAFRAPTMAAGDGSTNISNSVLVNMA